MDLRAAGLFVSGPLNTYVVDRRGEEIQAICTDCQRAYLASDVVGGAGAQWFFYTDDKDKAVAWCEAHVERVHGRRRR